MDKYVEIGDYFDRKSRQTAGPEGFPHFHTKGKKENMELNWSIIFSPFCGKLLPLIHRIQGVDKGTGGNVDSYFVTVYSSARTRQMSCLHEQMTGSERTKGAPVLMSKKSPTAISRSCEAAESAQRGFANGAE